MVTVNVTAVLKMFDNLTVYVFPSANDPTTVATPIERG